MMIMMMLIIIIMNNNKWTTAAATTTNQLKWKKTNRKKRVIDPVMLAKEKWWCPSFFFWLNFWITIDRSTNEHTKAIFFNYRQSHNPLCTNRKWFDNQFPYDIQSTKKKKKHIIDFCLFFSRIQFDDGPQIIFFGC